MKVMGLFIIDDECCQTVDHHRRGLSEVKGVVVKAQSPEGGELALKERAARGKCVW